ncbi:hypothetical protein [Halorubrum yunnanense]|uniref:Uncharacterized protein n=1 Tax=Halorubrum yunnanense TaxID=1526162 RepID=A0ABD5YI75_9EURY|nr:hypothetical protein [Halorubrum yunnanense]
MDIGFDFGANAPTGVFALHAAAAAFFLYIGVENAAAGESLGLALNALIGAMLVAAGVVVARITARRA